MVDQRFELETWEVEQAQVIPALIRGSVSRKILPVATILQEKDKQFTYWKSKVDFIDSYSMDPQGAPLVYDAISETEVLVPIIEYGYALNRSEFERVSVSRHTLQSRFNALLPYFRRVEDEYAILGNAANDVTSFADTANNSTALTTEINVTTQGLLKSTLTDAIDQLATAIGDYETLKGRVLMLGMSNDVNKKAVSVGLTAGGEVTASQRIETLIDLATALLLKYGAPGSGVWTSNLLGGSVATNNVNKRTVTPGALNSVLYPWGDDVAEIVASPFKTIMSEDPIKGKLWNFTERWVPTFKQQALVLYGATSVIA